MSAESFDGFELRELVAVSWSSEMAQRFPRADHAGCRQEWWYDGDRWHAYDPARCHGWHCNRCGAPTNSYGHHDCPDRPPRDS